MQSSGPQVARMYDTVHATIPIDNIDTNKGDDDIDINNHTVHFLVDIGEE